MGSALSAPGGSGIAGAQVLLAGQAVTTTDKKGHFTLSGLKPGEYSLTLQHGLFVIKHIQVALVFNEQTHDLIVFEYIEFNSQTESRPHRVIVQLNDT